MFSLVHKREVPEEVSGARTRELFSKMSTQEMRAAIIQVVVGVVQHGHAGKKVVVIDGNSMDDLGLSEHLFQLVDNVYHSALNFFCSVLRIRPKFFMYLVIEFHQLMHTWQVEIGMLDDERRFAQKQSRLEFVEELCLKPIESLLIEAEKVADHLNRQIKEVLVLTIESCIPPRAVTREGKGDDDRRKFFGLIFLFHATLVVLVS